MDAVKDFDITTGQVIRMSKRKPILCVDFDGVVHSYTSGWKGAENIPDAPVPGALEFLQDSLHHFRVMIFSSRSNTFTGRHAMQMWLERYASMSSWSHEWWLEIEWPEYKPSAFLTIDDRAITFTGRWPSMGEMTSFQPWWQKVSAGAIAHE